MKRSCDACGTDYEAKRPTSRFCSGTCQKRARRSGAGRPVAAAKPVVAASAEGGEGDGAVATTVETLKAAGRLNTPRGQMAVALARRIDSSTAVMGFAALTKELDRMLEAAVAGAQVVADPVDELRARRDRKVGA